MFTKYISYFEKIFIKYFKLIIYGYEYKFLVHFLVYFHKNLI